MATNSCTIVGDCAQIAECGLKLPFESPHLPSWWTFRIFFIFFSARGGGRGSPRPPGGGGVRFLMKNPRRGSPRRGRGRGAGRVSAANWGFGGGGGLNFFFRGRNVHQAILFKIITRIKLLFSNYLGRYSYRLPARQELISVTVTVLWV